MSDYQSMLQELKDTVPVSVKVEEKTNKSNTRKAKPQKKDPTLPFSQREMDDLSRELLNYDAAYDEPVFEKKTKHAESTKVTPKAKEIFEKKEHIVVNNTEVLKQLTSLQNLLERVNAKIEVNTHTQEANMLKIEESPQPLEIVKLLVSETGGNADAKYLLQTKEGTREIALSEYYDMSKFISMLQQYRYSLVLDKDMVFEDAKFNLYRRYLTTISQNLLANSFRFFEKSNILSDIIKVGQELKVQTAFVAKAVDELETVFVSMQSVLKKSEYQKDFYFAKFFSERGYVLNAITIMNEMLGEYVVESARTLSPYANERIQSYIDKIELSRSTRKAYYKLYSSARDFFKSHFTKEEVTQVRPFFPFRDSSNEEIALQMQKLYTANKGNKAQLFHSYSELIDRVRYIRNDLAHGNTSRAYKDITAEMDEILVDFEYLAMKKQFLQK